MSWSVFSDLCQQDEGPADIGPKDYGRATRLVAIVIDRLPATQETAFGHLTITSTNLGQDKVHLKKNKFTPKMHF